MARNQRHRQMQKQESMKEASKLSESYQDGLEDFESILLAFTRYRY